MYKNVLFDLYGTLVDIKTDEKKASLWLEMADYLKQYNIQYHPDELRLHYRREIRRQEGILLKEHADVLFPEVDILKVFNTLFLEKGAAEPSAETLHQFARAFRKSAYEHINLFDGAKDLLRSLKAAGKNVYLLSNAQHAFTMPELEVLGIADCFDRIYLSSDYCCKKPDPLFYMQLITDTGINPAESIMVGNDELCDIRGAQKIGLDTLFMKSPQTPINQKAPTATYRFNEVNLLKMKEILLQVQQ